MHRILAIAAAVGAALVLGACGDDAGGFKVSVPDTLAEPDRSMAVKAIEALAAACPRLRDAWPDFTKAEADIEPASMSESRGAAGARGWGRTVLLQVTVDGQARHFPADIRAWGHTLQFVMGGGRKPGIYVMKDQAGWICGMEPGTTYKDVPDLAVVR